jgi:hypothetical protein
MNWKFLFVVTFILGGAAIVMSADTDAPNAGGEAGAEPDFKGKILMVSMDENGGVIQNGRVQRLAGRAFLVGESTKMTENDKSPEETMWFPVDKLTALRVFKNIEDARRVYEDAAVFQRQAVQ